MQGGTDSRDSSNVRRFAMGIILSGLLSASALGIIALVLHLVATDRDLQELRRFRAGIPATMLPKDRPRFTEFPIVYKGAKMTARHYPSSARGTAANADYFVIINREGIVEAAFSTDVAEGGIWAGKYAEDQLGR